MNPHARLLNINIRPCPRRLAQRINDGVLQFESAKVRMGDERMSPTEIARKRRARPDVRRPVNPTDSAIKPLCVTDLKPTELQKHTIGYTGFQARSISGPQPPRKRHTRGALFDIL